MIVIIMSSWWRDDDNNGNNDCNKNDSNNNNSICSYVLNEWLIILSNVVCAWDFKIKKFGAPKWKVITTDDIRKERKNMSYSGDF